jgi:hypothetical protein
MLFKRDRAFHGVFSKGLFRGYDTQGGNEFPELKERVLYRFDQGRAEGEETAFVCGAAQAMLVAGTRGWVGELFDYAASASTGSMRTSS